MCDNGQCVPPYLLCDGPDHCGDNSDEVGCSTLCIGLLYR